MVKGNIYGYGRLFRLASPFYKPEEYPQLRDFYQKTNTEDQAQLVLKLGDSTAATPAPTPTPSGK